MSNITRLLATAHGRQGTQAAAATPTTEGLMSGLRAGGVLLRSQTRISDDDDDDDDGGGAAAGRR